MSIAYGLGFVVGPALGGYLSKVSLYIAPSVATVASLISLLIVVCMPFPKSTGSHGSGSSAGGMHVEDVASKMARTSSDLVQGLKAALRAPVLLWSLGLKTLFSFSLAVFHGTFPLITDRFGLDPAGTGYLMSYIGVIGMATQAGLVGYVTSRLPSHTVTVACTAITTAAFLAYSQIGSIAALYAVCTPLVVSNTIFQQVNTKQVSAASPHGVKGILMATDMAIFSGMRIWTPSFGARLLTDFGFHAVGLVSGATNGLMFALLATGIAHCEAQTPVTSATVAAATAPSSGDATGNKDKEE